jgi:hypothetical protein
MGVPSEKCEDALHCARQDMERVREILEGNPDDLYPDGKEELVQILNLTMQILVLQTTPKKESKHIIG